MCVTCHVCGRDFGTASFQIHLFQCEKKWEAQEARKKLEERRPVPTAPEVAANASLEDRNSAAATKWSEEALVAMSGLRADVPSREPRETPEELQTQSGDRGGGLNEKRRGKKVFPRSRPMSLFVFFTSANETGSVHSRVEFSTS